MISFSFSQGTMNALGLGKYYENQGTSNALDGLNLLTPSISKDINFSNPSTWHNLKYTYLSLSYSVDQTTIENPSIINGYSGLSNALWIVPIKSKYSIGLSIAPFINQKVTLIKQDTIKFYAFEDTLDVTHSNIRSGGLMSFNLGASYRFNQKFSLGIIARILFGSSRQSESITFGGSDIIQTARNRYNGLISDMFLSIKLRDGLTAYSSVKGTLRPLESVQQNKYLFDDVNSNGYHDWNSPYFDFPFPDSVETYQEYRISDLYNPNGYKLGLNKLINKKAALAFEWSSEIDNSKKISNIFLPLNKYIHTSRSIKISYSKFSNPVSLKLFDKVSFRSGVKYSYYLLGNSTNSIEEYGCSIGSGLKFKNVGNQIDINYYFGYRNYPNDSARELTQQLQVGISLADIWFIKRRQK